MMLRSSTSRIIAKNRKLGKLLATNRIDFARKDEKASRHLASISARPPPARSLTRATKSDTEQNQSANHPIAISPAIISACFNTVSVANFCMSGG